MVGKRKYIQYHLSGSDTNRARYGQGMRSIEFDY